MGLLRSSPIPAARRSCDWRYPRACVATGIRKQMSHGPEPRLLLLRLDRATSNFVACLVRFG